MEMPVENIAEKLKELSAEELQKMIEEAEKTLEQKQREQREEVKRKIREMAAAVGLEVSFRVKGKAEEAPRASLRRGKVAPKYRHPENPELTWSGRGQMPRWLGELVEAGHDREEFRIRD